MAVQLDACIHCNLCQRACRDVQVNDVIGIGNRGKESEVFFDFNDQMNDSTCVACGECVEACPTGALMPKTAIDLSTGIGSKQTSKDVASVCPFCGVGCQLSYKIEDNKIKHVEGRDGPANENRLCVKGRFGFDYIHSPERLTTALIRKEGAPKGLNIDPANPYTHFRKASLEEALELAAEGMAKTASAHGNEAVAGFGSAKCSNEEAYLFQKLIRERFGHNHVDHCTRLCHASSVAALMEGIGSGAVTATFNEALNSDLIVLIGSNPTSNHPVAATYFKQAVKNGAKMMIMDPRAQQLTNHADYFLQFRPGSDVHLLNAMLNVIITEELYDKQFIQGRTDNYEAVAKHVENFTPEVMSKLCGIEPDAIRNAARAYAKAERAIIFWGMGVSQHVHGTDNVRCLISLAMITGQIGRPGTGLHPLRGQNNVQGASDAGLIPMVLPDYQHVDDEAVREKYEAAWGFPINPTPGLTVVEIMDAITKQDIRSMYILGENPAMSDPDVEHARAALAKLDHLVVQDIFLTETAMYADVVLPATAWPEKDGTVTNTNRQVQMGRKAVEAPGDALNDWELIQSIAKRLGLNWSYTHPKEIYTEMASLMPSLDNITWDRLMDENAVTYPSDGPDHPGHAVVFGDRFPTETGRANLVPTQSSDPNEQPDDTYPFILTTGRQLEHWHTGAMTRRSKVLDAIEPSPTASINPETLSNLNISPGDMVEVETRRGKIQLTARVDKGMQKDVIFIPFAYVEAAANILTNPQLDPVGKIPEFKYCAAKICKYEPKSNQTSMEQENTVHTPAE
jgi:formate dehydrogenase major subunit